jgi:geranylgeranyl diphosphate synthase type II
MMTPRFKNVLAARRRIVEKALHRFLPRGWPALLDRSAKYSLFAPGKRLRPVLTLLTCEALGGRETNALPAACAIEMIHCYSLIHDDLPAMDDDDFRRGRPSNHKAFDEATAILAGDALLTAAFEVVAANVKDGKLAGAMTRELAVAAGGAGMVGGQVLDLSRKAGMVAIHSRKTAALFRVSTHLGALAAKAPPARVRSLAEYGFQIGLAFQAVDDILDDEADPRTAKKHARRCTDRAVKSIAFLRQRGEILREIAEFLYSREK